MTLDATLMEHQKLYNKKCAEAAIYWLPGNADQSPVHPGDSLSSQRQILNQFVDFYKGQSDLLYSPSCYHGQEFIQE